MKENIKREMNLKKKTENEFSKVFPCMCDYHKMINELIDKIYLTRVDTTMLSDDLIYDYLEEKGFANSDNNFEYDFNKVEPDKLTRMRLSPVMYDIAEEIPWHTKLSKKGIDMWGEAFKKLDKKHCVGICLGVNGKEYNVELYDFKDFIIAICEGRFVAFKRLDDKYMENNDIITSFDVLKNCIKEDIYLPNAPVEYLDLIIKKED